MVFVGGKMRGTFVNGCHGFADYLFYRNGNFEISEGGDVRDLPRAFFD